MENFKKNLKPKYIAVAVALIGGVYLYNSFSKEAIKETAKDTAVGLAKDAGKFALGKAREKLNEKMHGGAVLSSGEPTAAPTGSEGGKTLDDLIGSGTTVQRTQIGAVEDGKFISIDNVNLTSAQAEDMLMNSIKSMDLERVKYLVSSGVKIDFTDDKICSWNYYGANQFAYGDRGYTQHDMPADGMAMKKSFKYINPTYMFTTECSKLFLLAALSELKREFSESEFVMFGGEDKIQDEYKRDYYRLKSELGFKDGPKVKDAFLNGEGQFKAIKEKYFAEKKAEKTQEQKVRREIVEFLLSVTPKKDYYQFAHAIGNSDYPQDLRVKLANLYIKNIDNLPVSEGRKNFLKTYEAAAVALLQESPTNKEWLSSAIAFKTPLYSSLVSSVDGLVSNLADGISQVEGYRAFLEREKSQRPNLSNIVLPELNVKTTELGQYDPFIRGLNEDVVKFADPKGYTNIKDFSSREHFLPVYLANREMEIARLLMASGKVNVNAQNPNGESILHHIVLNASGNTNKAVDRAAAIVVRYLLNTGVNPGLLDKKGNSPHAALIMQENEFNRTYSYSGAFSELKNAFTLKQYN